MRRGVGRGGNWRGGCCIFSAFSHASGFTVNARATVRRGAGRFFVFRVERDRGIGSA